MRRPLGLSRVRGCPTTRKIRVAFGMVVGEDWAFEATQVRIIG